MTAAPMTPADALAAVRALLDLAAEHEQCEYFWGDMLCQHCRSIGEDHEPDCQWSVARDRARAALAVLERLREERDEARAFGEEAARRYNDLLARERLLTCAYCGHEFPPGTPPSQHEALTEHGKVCAKHPMRGMREAAVEECAAVCDERAKWIDADARRLRAESSPAAALLDAEAVGARACAARIRALAAPKGGSDG